MQTIPACTPSRPAKLQKAHLAARGLRRPGRCGGRLKMPDTLLQVIGARWRGDRGPQRAGRGHGAAQHACCAGPLQAGAGSGSCLFHWPQGRGGAAKMVRGEGAAAMLQPVARCGGRRRAGALQQPARLGSSVRRPSRPPGRGEAPCCRCPAALGPGGAAGRSAPCAHWLGQHGQALQPLPSHMLGQAAALAGSQPAHEQPPAWEAGLERTAAPATPPAASQGGATARRRHRPAERLPACGPAGLLMWSLLHPTAAAGHRPHRRWPQQAGAPHRSQEREPLCQAAGEGEGGAALLERTGGGQPCVAHVACLL